MSVNLENPPFERGNTFYNGGTIDTSGAADADGRPPNVGGFAYEGKEFEFEDVLINSNVGAASVRGNNKVRVRCVRNINASALLPKQVVGFNTSGTTSQAVEGMANGVATLGTVPAGIADEFLPAAGCVQYDLCYIVIDGVSKVVSTGNGTISLAPGTIVVSGYVGKANQQDTTQTGAGVFTQVNSVLGMSVDTASTNNATFQLRVKCGRNY